METHFTYVLLEGSAFHSSLRSRSPLSVCSPQSLCATANMSTCKSATRIALAAVMTLIAGVSDAFVAPPSMSGVSSYSKIDVRAGSKTRADRSSLSMGADGGTTRGEQGREAVPEGYRQRRDVRRCYERAACTREDGRRIHRC